MELGGVFRDLIFDYTLRTVAIGSAVLGLVGGALGSFAVLRRQSLLGDAISHAALPGIALAFLVTRMKSPLVLILGAAFAGWVGTLLIMGIVRTTRIKYDTALGMVLSVFFGLGLVLLTFIQKMPDARQAGLETFLFGQASTLLGRDVLTVSVIGVVAMGVMLLFWKELKLLSFDPDYGHTLGYPIRALDILLTSLVVVAIVIGLQTVGVVLMSAMIVAPGAAARQWTDRLAVMTALAAGFGAAAGISGAVISSTTARLPTGPTIVVCLSLIVGLSLLMAPNRGLAWGWVRAQRNRRVLQVEAVLADLYGLASQHSDLRHPHSIAMLKAIRPRSAGVAGRLRDLEKKGWVEKVDEERWALTPSGAQEARKFLRDRGDDR